MSDLTGLLDEVEGHAALAAGEESPDMAWFEDSLADAPRLVAALRAVLRQADALDELAASPIGASYAGALRLGARGIRHAITKAMGAES